jgi:hypothetical protein
VDLLALGHSDTKVAKQVGVARETVCRWRSHSPKFQAALNGRRAALYQASADRLRALTGKALDILEDDMKNGPGNYQTKAAIAVLRLARLPGVASAIGDPDADRIVRRKVEEERKAARGTLSDLLEQGSGLPAFEEHLARTWDALEGLADGDGPAVSAD